MASSWRPTAGQVALIEFEGARDRRVTGVVLGGDEGPIVVHLGGRPAIGPGEVVASFVGADALYRVHATLSVHDGTDDLVGLVVHRVERVQRRTASRVALNLPVVLSNFDDPGAGDSSAYASVQGHSVDLGEGGCRVRVPGEFPAGCDPTVSLELPGGTTVVALAAVSQAVELPDGHEYRLVFLEMDEADRSALRDLISEGASA